MTRTPLIALGSAVLILGTLSPVVAHADTISISGTVTAGGAGLADVEVDFGNQSATTGSDGSFSLPVDSGSASAGWVLIGGTSRSGTFAADDGRTYATSVVGAGGVQAAAAGLVQPIAVSDLASLPTLTVQLAATGSISGSNPTLAGADVSVFDAGGFNSQEDAQADASGSYAVTGLAPGKYLVRIDGDEHTDASSMVQVSAGSATTYAPTLTAHGKIAGKVTVAKKAPGAAVPVEAGNASELHSHLATSKSGAYSIADLTAGSYTARYGTFGTGSTMAAGKWIPQSAKVSVVPGATTTKNVDLKVGGTIAFSVKKESGAKSVSYSVRKGSTTYAQRQMSFGKKSTVTGSATGLASGSYSVAVSTDTGKMFVKTVKVTVKKTTKLSVKSFPKKALTISGTVPGLSSGTVYVSTKDAANTFAIRASIGAGGAYKATGLVPDTYLVAAYGDHAGAEPSVTVNLTKSTTLTVHTKGANGSVAGTVTLDGIPVADADVHLLSSTGDEEYVGTDENGALTNDALTPGTYTIEAVLYSDSVPMPQPYWLGNDTAITVSAGQKTDLGTVALQVHGG